MTSLVKLSILLTTHGEKQDFDSLLLRLLRFNRPDTELIIINDASDAETADEIHRLLQKHPNEQAYLFEHEGEKGRGFCLNEALSHSEGSLIWAPLKAERLNEGLLGDAIRRFKSDPAAFWSLDYYLPSEPDEWIRMAQEGELPDDSCLVWNRSVISASDLFFNPFLQYYHGAELAMRLSDPYSWHTIDPFFVVSEFQSPIITNHDLSELIHSLLRLQSRPETRASLMERLEQLRTGESSGEEDLLTAARNHLQGGDANKALDKITRFLKRNPGHHEASGMKVIALERLRRHVEAAELKHQLKLQERELRLHAENWAKKNNSEEESSDQPAFSAEPEEPSELVEPAEPEKISPDEETLQKDLPEEDLPDPVVTVVIPTAGAGRPLLESVLVELEQAITPHRANLIVIDNCSIDNTFDYLSQLQEKGFMNIKVITNDANRGFGASVNQGLDMADTEFVLVMHNDLYPDEGSADAMIDALRRNPDVLLAAPMLDESSNSVQELQDEEEAELIEMETADSCCFMVRSDLPIRFDESYGLFHFEMDDFCRRIRSENGVIAAVTAAKASHKGNESIDMMGLRMVPELKWRNREKLIQKWGSEKSYEMPDQGDHVDRFIALGAPDNPADPPEEWKIAVQNYLTDEVKTDIQRRLWDLDELTTIVSTLLIADERELLRNLEDRLNDLEPDPSLLLLLINYYYRKNIFSRCRHYLKKANGTHPAFDLYRLKILIADKELDEAAPLLTKLMTRYPASPDLFSAAGDLYKVAGDKGEAKSFYALANQTDPFRFKTEETAFEIRL